MLQSLPEEILCMLPLGTPDLRRLAQTCRNCRAAADRAIALLPLRINCTHDFGAIISQPRFALLRELEFYAFVPIPSLLPPLLGNHLPLLPHLTTLRIRFVRVPVVREDWCDLLDSLPALTTVDVAFSSTGVGGRWRSSVLGCGAILGALGARPAAAGRLTTLRLSVSPSLRRPLLLQPTPCGAPLTSLRTLELCGVDFAGTMPSLQRLQITDQVRGGCTPAWSPLRVASRPPLPCAQAAQALAFPVPATVTSLKLTINGVLTTGLWAVLSGLRVPEGLQTLSLAIDIGLDHRPQVAVEAPAPARPWLCATPLRGCLGLTVLEVCVSGRGWPSTGYEDLLHLALGVSPARLERLYVERLEPPALELDYGGSSSDSDSDPDEGECEDGFDRGAVALFARRFPGTQLHLARRL